MKIYHLILYINYFISLKTSNTAPSGTGFLVRSKTGSELSELPESLISEIVNFLTYFLFFLLFLVFFVFYTSYSSSVFS